MQPQQTALTNGRRSQVRTRRPARRGLRATGRRHARVIGRLGEAVAPVRCRALALTAAGLPAERC